MITMQKPGESSLQNFSLPLTTLASESSQSGGALGIVIKYRHFKLATPHVPLEYTTETQVCLAVEVVRACGLKVCCVLKSGITTSH